MSEAAGPPRCATAAIIAGGNGRRLGGAVKPLLEVRGRTILARQREVLAKVFPRVVLVVGEDTSWVPAGLPLVRDRVPGSGPLGGIEAALGALPPSEEAIVCVAGDLPFLDEGLLRLLRDHATQAPALVPRIDGHAEPLLARYDQTCLDEARQRLVRGLLKLQDFVQAIGPAWLDEAELRRFDPTLRSFENVNTPDDLSRASDRRNR